MLIFRKYYFLLAVILFLTEIVIAIFIHDNFVRPYLGDFLVVILMYCSCRSFFEVRVINAAIGVLLFAYVVEISQYFHFIARLGWQHSVLARVIFGSSFAWSDIIAYTLAAGTILLGEKSRTFITSTANNEKPALRNFSPARRSGRCRLPIRVTGSGSRPQS